MIWDDSKVVAFDFETSGTLPEYALQPWRYPEHSWVTSVSLIRNDGKGLVAHGSRLSPTIPHMRQMLEEIIANSWTVVGWNVAFDISWLFAMGLGDMAMKINWLDGMLLWRHLEVEPEYEFQTQRHNRKKYRLKPEGIERFLPIVDATYGEDVDFHATDPENLAKLQKYNDRDSVYTWIIASLIWADLTEKQRSVALCEAACLPLVAEANYSGMVVDTLAANELSAHMDAVAAEMLAKLAPHGVTEKVVRSPLQLSKLMFDPPAEGGWGLPVLKLNKSKTTGKETRSTDKEVLYELAFSDPRCADLRTYRECLGNRAKFADAPVASAVYNSDGRSRPSAFVFGTYSGRLTYGSKQGKGKDERQTGWALHQGKRDKEFRNIIIPPPGYTLMEFDASGQEFRWMAVASGDETMRQLCMPGEDPHGFMGARVMGEDYRELVARVKAEEPAAEAARQLGKVGNLSLAYRTSAKKLRSVARVQYGIPMELPEAQRLHATYQQTYTRVPQYWNEQITETKRCGYVETLAGRRVKVVGNWGGEWGWSMGSTAINYRIQGTGADQKYLALQVLRPYLAMVGAKFAWDLHDGIYLYVPDAMVQRVAVEGKYLLDNLPYKRAWGFTPPVPMPWDCKSGPSWGGLRKWVYG